jgi:hypothetical protein
MDKDIEITMRKCNGMSTNRRAAEESQKVAMTIIREQHAHEGQVTPSAQVSSDANTLLGEQRGVVIVDISVEADDAPLVNLVMHQDDGGGDAITVRETLDPSLAAADDAPLPREESDVSMPCMLHDESPSACAPVAADTLILSESENEIETSESSSMNDMEEGVDIDGDVAHSRVQELLPVQPMQPVQTVQLVQPMQPLHLAQSLKQSLQSV